jgi:hypothetical protein
MTPPNKLGGAGESPAPGAAGRSGVRSDPPPEDLKRERDTFIQQFFRRGAQISEELLGDIERLRGQVQDLEGENARLRAQVASDGAIRELLRKIEELEAEQRKLLHESTRSETPQAEYARRFAELEAELAQLGTLHVANLQLHASMSIRRAFKSIRELLAQFLGAAQFALYWSDDDPDQLVPVAVEGLTVREARDVGPDESPRWAPYRSGQIWVDDASSPAQGSPTSPAAIIPLHMGAQRLGAVVIFRTLAQKTEFEKGDLELFKLLSTQAAPAIVHAHLFTQAGRKAPGIQAFIDQED